jgi:hypothetical protein
MRNIFLVCLLGLCAVVGCVDNKIEDDTTEGDMTVDMPEQDSDADMDTPDTGSEDDMVLDADMSEPDVDMDAPDADMGDVEMDVPDADMSAPDTDMEVDPCTLDSDFDLISDCDEDLLGTDKTKGDTDGDGLFDFEEFQQGTDPRDPDSDGDGVGDLQEISFGLNPNNPATYFPTPDGSLWIINACEDAASEPVNYYKSVGGDWLIALPPAFNNYVEPTITNAGPRQALAVFDDPANEVAGFVLSLEDNNPSKEQALSTLLAHKAKIASGVGTIIQNVEEGAFDTHDGNKAAPGRYLFNVTNKSARRVRDDLLFRLTPFRQADVTGMPVASGNAYNRYRVFVTVIDRGRRSITLVAVAPSDRFDTRDAVQFRMYDLTNTTGIAQADDDTELVCFPFPTSTQVPTADFYMVLDQSGSMSDDFAQVQSFAANFFNVLRNTALDFRIGITNMDPDKKGRLRPQTGWFNPSTSVAAFNNEITQYVTNCSVCSGSDEFGLWVGQEGIKHMRSAMAAPAERIRPDAQVVAIMMSDEQDNSFQNFTPSNPAIPHISRQPAAQILSDFKAFYIANAVVHAIVSNGSPCGEDASAYRDVALATGGTTADLCAASLQETIIGIIENTAGRASTFRLPTTPISASLRVYRAAEDDPTVGQWVPRSRVDGFDYFPQTNSIAFFGSYRPRASVQMCADNTGCEPGSICSSGRCRFPVQVAVQYQRFVDRTKISDAIIMP